MAQIGTPSGPAPPEDDLRVYTDAPRIFLTPSRLRLLQRERDRKSLRWEQFDLLMTGGAKMPEPGFAEALYYRIAGDTGSGRRAVDWALTNEAQDLHQLALVYDWCGPVMTDPQTAQLGVKIERMLGAPAAAEASEADVRRQSVRILAIIAIADRYPDHGEAMLTPILQWWRGVAGKLESGEAVIARPDTYALFEMSHAFRDNLKLDLREDARRYFRIFPFDHLASHYPATFQTPENDFRVPVFVHDGDPDVAELTFSRAAELAMVAFDANDAGNQYVQGWLMQDRFMMKAALGAPYEFLWANPYQPGLSYMQAPLIAYDPLSGHLFARTSWEEDATWIGYFEGHLQLFRDGRITVLRAGAANAPLRVGDASIMSVASKDSAKFPLASGQTFVMGLAPNAAYDVEIDDEELSEAETDNGGTLVLTQPDGVPDSQARVRKRP